MKSVWVMVCLLAWLNSANAQAQYGVSNARDASGNLVRNNGLSPSRTLAQPPVNNLGRPDHRPAVVAAPKTSTANGATR